MRSHKVGEPIQLFKGGGPPLPGQILHLGRPHQADDGKVVSVVAWNPQTNAYERYDNVPHSYNPNPGGLYFVCVHEESPVEVG